MLTRAVAVLIAAVNVVLGQLPDGSAAAIPDAGRRVSQGGPL